MLNVPPINLAGHDDAITGALLGLATSAPLAAGVVDVPQGAPWWAGYLATLAVALAPLILKYVMSRPAQQAPAPAPAPCPPPAAPVAPAPSADVVNLDEVRAALEKARAALPPPKQPEVKQ